MAEPIALEAEGDKALRTGLLKWSKDFVLAATRYDEAATLFKASGRYDKAAAVYQKLIEVGRALKDNWAVGKAYEGLIDCNFLRDHERLNVDKTLELCDAAVSSFALEGALNSFLTLMDKLARHFEKAGKATECLAIYARIYCYLLKYEDSVHRKDYFFSYLRVLLDKEKFSEALALLAEEIGFLGKEGGVGSSPLVLNYLLVCFLAGDEQALKSSAYLK